MSFVLAFEDVWLNLKRLVVEMDLLAFITIIALLCVLLMALYKYVVKYSVNVNVIKRNVAMPLFFSIVVFALLIVLIVMRSN